MKVIRRLLPYIALATVLLGAVRFVLPFFVFMPSSQIAATPAAAGLAFDDVFLTTSDGLRIHGWYIPAPNARATLLFFHGNGGNISHRLGSIQIFHDLGLSVFIVSYRGYGQSEGRPSIAGTALDALAAWDWLTRYRQIPAGNIVIFGRSLGGAVAMELAATVTPRALILESTFSSLADMTPFPAFAAPFLLGGNFWPTAESAAAFNAPLLIIHSPQDEVVPYRQGRRIYEAARSGGNEVTFLEIQGSHNAGFMQSIELYFAALDGFLARTFGEN
ncbi:MAG: alpha/beta hydrolase [Spirochaetes bacterium]|nr:alpha/beta hydrolase [Spirochaetota bacterium]